MYKFLLVVFAGAMTTAPSVAKDTEKESAVHAKNAIDAAPSAKKAAKNKIKDRRHPDYVRCRSEPIIGSLARKRRVCLTNRQWAEVAREGNAYSRELVEGAMSNANNGN